MRRSTHGGRTQTRNNCACRRKQRGGCVHDGTAGCKKNKSNCQRTEIPRYRGLRRKFGRRRRRRRNACHSRARRMCPAARACRDTYADACARLRDCTRSRPRQTAKPCKKRNRHLTTLPKSLEHIESNMTAKSYDSKVIRRQNQIPTENILYCKHKIKTRRRHRVQPRNAAIGFSVISIYFVILTLQSVLRLRRRRRISQALQVRLSGWAFC